MSKRLAKYIASFDYFDKPLIVLSVTTGSISITSFATVIGAPLVMVGASFRLSCSVSTGIVKKMLKTTRNKKKKHNKIAVLARSKLINPESKISEASVNNNEIILAMELDLIENPVFIYRWRIWSKCNNFWSRY